MAKYRYIGGDPEKREGHLQIIENFELLKSGPALVKDDWKSTVLRVESGGETIYCKRFSHGGLLNSLKNQLRRSKALSSYRAGRRAAETGIAVPEHLAAIEKRVWGFLVESYLMTRAVEGALPVHKFFDKRFRESDGGSFSRKRTFIRSLAGFVAAIHRKGVYHRDLKGTNLLVSEARDGYDFHLLDLDGVSFMNDVPLPAIVKNLVQLNNDFQYVAGEFDRLRFFIYYLRETGLDFSREKKRSVAKEILRLTLVKVEHWHRSGKKLMRQGKSRHHDESIRFGE